MTRSSKASQRLALLALWGPVLVWAGIIFYLSSIPNLRITDAWYDILLRKMAHMFFFGVLARLIANAYTEDTLWSWKQIFYAALALTFFYACSDEFHQTFVAGRHGDVLDVCIDTFGGLLALGLKPD